MNTEYKVQINSAESKLDICRLLPPSGARQQLGFGGRPQWGQGRSPRKFFKPLEALKSTILIQRALFLFLVEFVFKGKLSYDTCDVLG